MLDVPAIPALGDVGPERRSPAWRAVVPGLLAVGALAFVATLLGRVVPVVGAPVFAIVGGILIATWRTPGARLEAGVRFSVRRVLQGSIVVLGTDLSLHQVLDTGLRSLPVLTGTLVVALGAAWLVGRRLRMSTDLNVLIGVGTAICGASAIAATEAVIGAAEADVAYAIATIFTFNVAAVVTFPTIGHLLGLSQHAFGLWAGTAINDTSSVVAASTIYGHAAATYGVVVKLTRTLAIIPICLVLALVRQRQAAKRVAVPVVGGGTDAPVPIKSGGFSWRAVMPLFIVGFLAAVSLNSVGLIPAGWHHGAATLAEWMITAALGAIGLSTRPRDIRRAGGRPLLLGAILWVIVGVTSLGLQLATGSI